MTENYNTRKARREAEKLRDAEANGYVKRWKSALKNAVNVKNLPKDLPKRYLLDTLFKEGKIAYDKETGLFLRFNYTSSIDAYGIPKDLNLYGVNGFTVHRKNNPDEVVILRANDEEAGLYDYLYQQAAKVVDFDSAIRQNLDAIRTQTIVEVDDESEILTLINAYESRRIGATVAYVNKNSNVLGDCFKVADTGAEYLVDKLIADRKHVINETYETLGLVGEQDEKAERVQGFEEIAGMSTCLMNLFVIIDTFNNDAKVGGLDIRLEANTPTVELMNIDKTTGEQKAPVTDDVEAGGAANEDMAKD